MKVVDTASAYRLFYPAVPVVVAAEHNGKVSAMPVVSMMWLSNNPALVGFSSSPSHDTLHTVLEAGKFTVSWLGEKHKKSVEKMGTTSGDGVEDKLSACGLHHSPEGSPPVPVVKEAAAFLICTLLEKRTYGDHELVVAKVDEAKASDDFSGYWSFREYTPIIYSGISGPTLRLS